MCNEQRIRTRSRRAALALGRTGDLFGVRGLQRWRAVRRLGPFAGINARHSVSDGVARGLRVEVIEAGLQSSLPRCELKVGLEPDRR